MSGNNTEVAAAATSAPNAYRVYRFDNCIRIQS